MALPESVTGQPPPENPYYVVRYCVCGHDNFFHRGKKRRGKCWMWTPKPCACGRFAARPEPPINNTQQGWEYVEESPPEVLE
jgi:hypothetical protein